MTFTLGVFFGLILGILIAVALLIGQALLHKKGIEITRPLNKLAKKDVEIINPLKEHRAKKIFEEL